MKYVVANPEEVIEIGFERDAKTKNVHFDVSDFLRHYPGCTCHLSYIRPGTTDPYEPENTRIIGSELVWNVSAADAEFTGYGSVQIIMLRNSDQVAHSDKMTVHLNSSHNTPGEPPENPVQAWFIRVMEAQDEGIELAEKVLNMTVEAETLPAGSEATAEYDAETGVMYFGIPAGSDCTSLNVNVQDITGGHRVTITDKDHPSGQSFDVMDGEPGQPGQPGQPGLPGQKGDPGNNGISPEVTFEVIEGGHSMTVTDAEHPDGQTINILDGADAEVYIDDTAPAANKVYSSQKVAAEVSSLNQAISDLDVGSVKYKVNLPFQGGTYNYDGTYIDMYDAPGTNASIPHMISSDEVAEINIHDGITASFLMYSGETYLGRIKEDGTLGKTSGAWKQFTGTVKMRELLENYDADGFRINVTLPSSLNRYEEAYLLDCCDFYSYTKPEEEGNIVNLKLANGSWKNAAYAYFSLTMVTTRLRPRNIVPVHTGDVIKINTDNGKYYGAYVLWEGYPGYKSKVPGNEIVFYNDQTIRVAFDGFYMQSFGLSANHSAEMPLSSFTGGTTLYKYSAGGEVIDQNVEPLKIAIASQRNFTNTSASNIPDNNLATFVHVTDAHGDRKALEAAYRVANYINADALIASGDMVYYYSNDDFEYVKDVADGDIDFLMCIGNHDAFQLNAAEQKAKYITPFATKYGYQLDASATNGTWYYKDYATKKMRVIVVNQFEYDGRSSGDTRMNFTQAQVNWLQTTLLATPAGYGVLIVMHSPERTPVKDNTYPKFYQDRILYSDTSNPSMTILTEMVDAFISRGSLSKTFNNRSGATPASVTVNVNFSSVNTGVEFIAFVNGHFHSDHVSYVADTENTQLQLNEVQSNSWYGMSKAGYSGSDNPWLTELSDLQRIAMTPTENAFNIYTIDRTAKTVRIVRIGANMPSNMSVIRDYMVIPYAGS